MKQDWRQRSWEKKTIFFRLRTEEIIRLCDHIILNSPAQVKKYKDQILAGGKSPGLRINPRFSTQEGHEIYDPCAPGSRLGTAIDQITEELLDGIEGLHFHTLCEQNSDALSDTLKAVEEQFGSYMHRMKWINFGGGHHITREDYDRELLKEYDLFFLNGSGSSGTLNLAAVYDNLESYM